MAEKKKVLFFDDEPFISDILAQSLRLFDWNVTLVTEIDKLFIELNISKFDVIILDIMAPIPESDSKYFKFTKQEINEMDDGMNTGVVVAKKIWEMPTYKDTPILFLSAKKDPRPDNPELQTDKCGYLRKPVLTSTVSEKLNELIKS